MAEDYVTDNQKIQILLAEYNGVRSHVVARTSASIQGCAILIASLTIVSPQIETRPVISGILIAVIAAVLLVLAKFIHSDLHREVAHLRRLETEINRRAGEPLLTYDTMHGVGATGLWKRLWLPR